ncbi:unnamed protein product [Durusdinium trenchii]|uniref:Uncharacterized protein n=1 Tax=Durusdinium trenchii TaxID=1381693 RepID=A0ABP0PQU3_9DINO
MGSGSSAHAKQNSRNQGSRSSQSSKKSHQMMGVVPYAGCGGASALSRFSVTCPTNRFFVAVGGLLVKQDQTRTSKGSKASARSRSASRPPNSATRSDAAMLARKSTMSRKSMKSVTFGADEDKAWTSPTRGKRKGPRRGQTWTHRAREGGGVCDGWPRDSFGNGDGFQWPGRGK